MRGVADHRHLTRRPALEADVLEAVVARDLADPLDQRPQVRKRARPKRLVDGYRASRRVLVQHGEREVELLRVAWVVEKAPVPRPVLDGAAVGRFRDVELRNEDADRAVGEKAAVRDQAEAVADVRVDAVGGDDQVGFDPFPTGKRQLTAGSGGSALRAERSEE